MKLKGTTVKASKKEYVIKDQLGQGGFSTIYETNHPEIICKAQVLMNSQMLKAYNKQKQILKSISHPNIIKLYDSHQIETKQNKYGLLFMQRCSNGTAFDILEKNQGGFVPEKTVVHILYIVADILECLHSKGIAHRDIKMENVLLNSTGEYKLCDFGSCSKTIIKNVNASNRVEIQEYIEKTTTPLYRSPQQIDLYSGYQIGVKVDIFALGVLGYMMCFQKPPFESRLSALNKQYFLPEDHSYSKELVQFIIKCFITNPLNRASATEVKQQLKQLSKSKRVQMDMNINRQFAQTIKDISHINEGNLKRNKTVAQIGFIDKIKRIYNQITTQTQGWIVGFIQESQEAPMIKYNRSIISKCYEKKYKIQKVYQLLDKYAEENKNRSLVTLKLLVLLHNFLRKGPKEAIMYEKDNSPLQLCKRVYKLWKTGMKTTDQEDFKRNTFVCLLVRSYSLILMKKIKFCFENSHLIESNYSIVPYLSNIKENTILKLGFINSMMEYLENCLDFHDNVQRVDYLTQIQKAIVLSMIDQQYCLISTLTFILSAFKMAVCYVKEDIDFVSLQSKVHQIESNFEDIYKRMAKLMQKAQKNSILLENSNITLNLEVISYIRNIKMEKRQGKFNVTDHLNYKNTIYGLKIPLTYEEVVKNPDFLKDLENSDTSSKLIVEVKQFKVNKQPLKQVQKQEKVSKKVVQSQSKIQKQTPKLENKVNQKGSPQSAANVKRPKQIPLPAKEVKKQVSNESPTVFSKQKNPKDKIFENFSFEQKNQAVKQQQLKPSHNLMEFTHQNLNKDFFSINGAPVEEKNDQFNDFFSIVQKKFEKQKVNKKNNQKQEPIIHSNASKQVFYSQTKPDINQIQLINFFFDDDQSENKNVKKQVKKQQKKQIIKKQDRVHQRQEKKESITQTRSQPNLIDFGENTTDSSIKKAKTMEKLEEVKQQLFVMEDDQEYVAKKQIKQASPKSQRSNVERKKTKVSPSREQNLIDLKQFVIEEVRKSAQQYIIDFSALIFKQKIGYGNSSQVFKGEWRGRQVAIKKIKDSLSKNQKQFKRQIMTSVKIRHHPQLVTLIGVCEHDKYFYIINQYCNGSTLFDLLHQSDQRLPWTTRINIAKQMARGMIFLHTNDPPIIHRDLKSLNVLLVQKYDQNNSDIVQLKIADFGLSRDYASTYMTGTLGTYHWMAPQIFNNQPYTLKADVFSFGIVLWEIASRVPPYTNMKNPHSLMKYVTVENGRPELNYIDKDCPYQWRMLMIRCWDKFPSNRPTFTQIFTCLEYLSK